MVSRIYVEKKPGFDVEAQQLLHELRTSGRSPWLMSWMHSLAESARWSNWPGRNSTPKTVAFASSGSSA